MTFLQAVVLGVIQGLTEFLPVSSSGHLVLAEALLNLRMTGVGFEVTVHLATLFAVIWVYRRRVVELAIGTLRKDKESLRYLGLLLLASLPTVAAGLLARDRFEAMFGRPVLVALLLLVTGLLVFTVHFTRERAHDPVPSAGQAVWIGLGQALAILPGISRAGATMAVGAWRGVEVIRLAEFSFLMSVPAVLGAAVLQLSDGGTAAGSVALPVLGAAFMSALVAGILAIQLFLRVLMHKHFARFAYYCWFVGGAYLAAAAVVPSLR